MSTNTFGPAWRYRMKKAQHNKTIEFQYSGACLALLQEKWGNNANNNANDNARAFPLALQAKFEGHLKDYKQ